METLILVTPSILLILIINSCLEIKPGKILKTLFRQGELIEINKKLEKTKVLLSNLKSPNHIRYYRKKFILFDARN